ncbi:uncharacterized protein LOC135391427 isoform X2 [Ornithodoros turicata]|uniref:uncharacterized protein LOC135391427 isoform X2 n=1 Tax=Ornithodoros turicata TaxID=34597 RepID=UPI0031387C0B
MSMVLKTVMNGFQMPSPYRSQASSVLADKLQNVAALHVCSAASATSSMNTDEMERSSFRMVGMVIMFILVLLVVAICVLVMVRPNEIIGGKVVEDEDNDSDNRSVDEPRGNFIQDGPVQSATEKTAHRNATRTTAITGAHSSVRETHRRSSTRSAASKQPSPTPRCSLARTFPPRKIACIYTFGETAANSYPKDGVCDYAIYVHLHYEDSGFHGIDDLALEGTTLGSFLEKSKNSRKTIFLATLASEMLGRNDRILSPAFVKHFKTLRTASNIRGFGIFHEYHTGHALLSQRHELTNLLNALRSRLKRIRGSTVFLGVRLQRLQKLSEASQYFQALNTVLTKPTLFILITHVSAHHEPVPEPTSAWTAHSFNDPDVTSLEIGLEFLKFFTPSLPNITFFMSFTLAVVQYNGANNAGPPANLGNICKAISYVPYRQGCVDRGFILNEYDSNEMVVFEVNTQEQVDRCYETVRTLSEKIDRVQSQDDRGNIGWALFNAEFEDNTDTGCTRDSRPFPRIRAVRKRLRANMSRSGAPGTSMTCKEKLT